MGTLRQLKSFMKKDEEFHELLVRSDRHEILLDLDGDGVPDIGLLDVSRNGDVDAIAMDLTGNGEFNFYLIDHDGNGIPDEIAYYRDGDDVPVKSVFGRTVETKVAQSAVRIHSLLSAVDLVADDILDALEELESFIAEEYARFEEEFGGEEEQQDKADQESGGRKGGDKKEKGGAGDGADGKDGE